MVLLVVGILATVIGVAVPPWQVAGDGAPHGMNAQAVVIVSGLTVTITQLVKMSNIPNKYALLTAVVVSALGVVAWGISQPAFSRNEVFDYLVGWAASATSAMGVFGAVRAVNAEGVTAGRDAPKKEA